jgi:hypothetical protein
MPICPAAVIALFTRTTTITQLSSGHQTIARNASVLDQSEPHSRRASSLARTLDLSESRAHGSTLQILRAYKLIGNFHVNCEIVLKDLAAFDKVTYEIEPESQLPFTQTADMLRSGLTRTFISKCSTKSCNP